MTAVNNKEGHHHALLLHRRCRCRHGCHCCLCREANANQLLQRLNLPQLPGTGRRNLVDLPVQRQGQLLQLPIWQQCQHCSMQQAWRLPLQLLLPAKLPGWRHPASPGQRKLHWRCSAAQVLCLLLPINSAISNPQPFLVYN